MLDSKRNILFVGAAENLQLELMRYRNLHPAQLRDQLWLLASRVHQIDWNPAPNKMAAEKMRNLLVRQCSPPFNSKRKVSEPQYLIVSITPTKAVLQISATPFADSAMIFGPWRNPSLLRKAQASLCRWIWWLANESSLDRMPPYLMKNSAAKGAEVTLDPKAKELPITWQKSFTRYLNGTSDLFVDLGLRKLESLPNSQTDSLHRSLLNSDVVVLETFFRRNLQLNKRSPVASAEQRLQ